MSACSTAWQCSTVTLAEAATSETKSNWGTQLEFNVPFQHKYGYIRDKMSGVENYTYPVKKGQRYINLNPGRLFVQQPPLKKRDREAHLNYYASAYNKERQLSHCHTKLSQIWQNKHASLTKIHSAYLESVPRWAARQGGLFRRPQTPTVRRRAVCHRTLTFTLLASQLDVTEPDVVYRGRPWPHWPSRTIRRRYWPKYSKNEHQEAAGGQTGSGNMAATRYFDSATPTSYSTSYILWGQSLTVTERVFENLNITPC